MLSAMLFKRINEIVITKKESKREVNMKEQFILFSKVLTNQ